MLAMLGLPDRHNAYRERDRPFVIGRRNSLFADTVPGVTSIANLHSLLQTCIANGIDGWRNHCDDVRPHSSLQYLTPAEFKLELRKELQPAVS